MNFFLPINHPNQKSRLSVVNTKMRSKVHYIRKNQSVPVNTASTASTSNTQAVSSIKTKGSPINQFLKALASKRL
jgi:hypothetical protein